MNCPKCGSEIREDKKFCPKCGFSLLLKLCPKCNSECDPNDAFCDACGTKLTQEEPPAKPTQPVPSQKTLLPSVTKGVEGTSFRKHLTVLVADVKSSMGMIGTLDPEEVKEIITPAIQKLSSIVFEYGGLVVSTTGDGITAVFGATHASENHSLRACLASLAMQKQIKSINKALTLRIGLSTGEVVFTVEGSKYEIVGAVVNLAARMPQTAKADTIRITENTEKLVASSVIVESLGPMEIKGFPGLVEIFELKSIKLSKSLNELASQFIERSPFVNREQELATLISLLTQAKEGKGNAIGLFADPGFGKSRFIYEIVKSDLAKDCNVLFTAGFMHTKEISLLPIRNLFRTLFGLLSDETDEQNIKNQIMPFLINIDSPLALSAALSLINLSPEDPKWIALEAALKRKYMFEVGTKLLLNFTLEKPLIFVIEDMHWVDSETEMFLDVLLSKINQYKIFVMINYRPEYRDHFINRANYTRIQLEPLNTKAGSKMLDDSLGTDPSLAEIKTKILSTVQGNPFFLEELVDSLITEKIFVGEPKNYRIREGTSVIKLSLPETIVAIVQTKIDKLPPLDRNILQVASVIGTQFLYSQVIQLMDPVDESEARMALNKLTNSQYIYESQFFPELGFAFTQAVTLEIAYNSMLKITRKNLHAKFFKILESTLKIEQIDQLQIIAEHAFLGENWEKAFFYCYIAARKVFDINGFLACIRLYEKALKASEHLPQDEGTQQKMMRIYYELYYALVPSGRFSEQFIYLQKGLELAIAKKDRFFECIINGAFCIHYLGFNDVNIAFQHAEKCYQIAKEVRSIDAMMISQTTLIHCYLYLARFKELFAMYEEMESTISGNLEFRSEWLRIPVPHLTLFYVCGGEALVGDFANVAARKEKWFAGSQNLDEPSVSNLFRFGAIGMCFYVKGEFEAAIQYLTKALQNSLHNDVFVYIPIFSSMLGEISARQNKMKEAKESVTLAIAFLEKLHCTYTTVFSFASIPNCLSLLGEYKVAKEFCEKATKILIERKNLVLQPILLRISAEIDSNLPNPNYGEIKQKIDEALRLTMQYGMLPSVGHSHLALSKLNKKMGNLDNSKAELSSALAIYEKLGMSYWIEHVKTMSV